MTIRRSSLRQPGHGRLPAAFRSAAVALCLATASGCALTAEEVGHERERLDAAGGPWREDVGERELPALPEQPDWRDVLQRALLANGDLEAAHHDWAAAVERARIEGAYPNTNVALRFSHMFSKEQMKAWDRTTVGAGFMPSMMLEWPTKTRASGLRAVHEAAAAGARFEAAKFDLQRRVLTEWLDYALAAERERVQRAHVALLAAAVETAHQQVRVGGPQRPLVRAQTELELAVNEALAIEAELLALRARLNGLLAREPTAPLAVPDRLPEPRPLPAGDSALLAAAVHRNPELAALAEEVAAAEHALARARLETIPNIAPEVAFTGSLSQMIGAMVTLPTTRGRIRGAIDEARAGLAAAHATARQSGSERAAAFAATLAALRDAERQTQVLSQSILPLAEQAVTTALRSYAAGDADFVEVIDAQRTAIDVRLMLAQMRVGRERRLAELEALAGVDAETLGTSHTPPDDGDAESAIVWISRVGSMHPSSDGQQ